MQSVWLCVGCQCCFTAEDTDHYCILYILAVTVYKIIYPTTSSQLEIAHSTHAHTHEHANVTGTKMLIFPLAYNIEGLETSHRRPSHSFLLQREVCVNYTISLLSYICAYVNRWLTVYQQLHCAVFSDSYSLILLAHYRAHWNCWWWL